MNCATYKGAPPTRRTTALSSPCVVEKNGYETTATYSLYRDDRAGDRPLCVWARCRICRDRAVPAVFDGWRSRRRTRAARGFDRRAAMAQGAWRYTRLGFYVSS